MGLERYKNINSLRPIKQYFEWGTVKWVHEPEDADMGKLMVAHVHFLPNVEQNKHLHTGDEQIMYILSGKGIQMVDGIEYPLSYGKIYHIPPYAEHYVKNLTDKPLEMIIVYNANSIRYKEFMPPIEFPKKYDIDNLENAIDLVALQRVQDKSSQAFHMSIVIKNEKGEIITEPSNVSEFCKIRCEYNKNCQLRNRERIDFIRETQVKSCCLDLATVHTPILVGDTYVGNIICGPVLLNEPSEKTIRILKKEMQTYGCKNLLESYLNIRVITKGRLYAIMESLGTMSNFIVESGVNNLGQQDLHQKTIQILEEQRKQMELEKALNAMKIEVLQAQLSPHFLFNTLGVIGELAYIKGAKEAAETTFALSNLLRQTLKRVEDMVKVRQEVNYIKDYLFIQKKRFQHSIEEVIDIDEELMDIKIPFMTLQLLAENTIIHGLEDRDKKVKLHIIGRKKGDYIALQIIDNGSGIRREALADIFCEKANENGEKSIGLANLKKRFIHYYGDNFKLEIEGQRGQGTRVSIELPIINNKEGVGNEIINCG